MKICGAVKGAAKVMNDVSGLDVTTDVWTLYGILCHFNASLYYG